MASENFLLNFDINLAPVEAKFQNFVNKARSAANEISSLPAPKLPTLNLPQAQSLQQAASQAGTARAGIQAAGQQAGLPQNELRSLQAELNKQVKSVTDGLNPADQAKFKELTNQQAAAVRKRLRGLETIAAIEAELATVVAQDVAATKTVAAKKARKAAEPVAAAGSGGGDGAQAEAKARIANAQAKNANTKATQESTVSTKQSAAAAKAEAAAKFKAAEDAAIARANLNAELAASQSVTAARTSEAVNVGLQNEVIKKTTQTDARTLAAKTENKVALETNNEIIKKEVNQSAAYLKAKAEAATQARIATQVAKRESAASEQLSVARIQAASAARISAAQESQVTGANPTVINAELAAAKSAQLAQAKQQLALQAQAVGVSLPKEIAASTNLASIKAELVRLKEQERAAAAGIREASRAELAAAKAKTAAAAAGTQASAVTLAAEKQVANELKITASLEAANRPEVIRAKAERLISEKALAKQNRISLAAEIRAQGGTNLRASRARFGFDAGGGGAAGGAGAGSGRGFFAGGALSSLKFGLPSLALFSGGSLILDSLNDAEELERLLLTLESQLQATVGPSRATAEFERLRDIIKDTSREVGLAGSEVAGFAIQFQGAFGEGTGREIEGQSGTDLVESQVFNASRFARISGLDDEIVFDDFSAASIAFEASAETIGNAAFAAQDAAGVSADEIVNFLGKIAPVAESAGFSLEEFSAIAATAQQSSGASGDVLAEQFGRIIPAVSGARVELLQLAATNDALNQQPFLDALATNDVAGIIRFLIAEYDNLGSAAQASVIELIGSRREAQALISVFENSDTFTRTLDGLADTTGRLDDRFEAFSGTFGQQLARLSQSFRQLLLALLDAGIADLIGLILESLIDVSETVRIIATAFGTLAAPLAPVIDFLREANELLGGFPAKIGLIAAALKLAGIGPALSISGAASGLGTAVGLPGSAPRSQGSTSSGGNPFVVGPTGVVQTPKTGLASARGRLNNSGAAQAAVFAGTSLLVAEAFQTLEEQQQIVADSVQELSDQLIEQTDEELQRLIDNSNTNGTRFNFAESILFGDDPADIAQRILDERNFAGTVDSLIELLDVDDGLDEFIDVITSDERNANFQQVLVSSIEEQGLGSDDLRAINDKFGDIFTFATAFGNGNNTPVNIKVDTDLLKDPAFIAFLQDQAQKGDEFAIAIIDVLDRALNDEDISALLQAELDARGDSFARAATRVESSSLDLSAAQAAFDQGTGSGATLIAAQKENLALLDSLLATPDATEDDLALILEQRNAAQIALDKTYSDIALEQAELTNSVIELREGDSIEGTSQQLDTLIALLNDPEFTNPEGRLKVAEEIISLQESFAQASIDATEDGVEKASLIANGVAVDTSARVEIVLSQLNSNNANFAGFLDAYVAVYQQSTDGFLRSLIGALALGDAGREFADDLIAAATADARRALNDAIALGDVSAINSASDLIAEISAFADAQDPSDLFEVQDITNIGADPAAGAAAAKSAAEKAASDAKKAADDRAKAAEELAEAQNAYLLALIQGDPVKTAQEQIRQAQEAVSKASTEADRIRAQIDVLNSERALEEALRDIGNAQTDLLVAQAEAAGRTVDAAQLSFQAAQEALAQVQADFANGNAGEADVLAAEANAVRAEAAARDTNLNSQVDEYEYLNEIGAITNQQLIQYLQQLKTVPGLIPDQLRDLDRKIKELNSEIGADLQFNLPTNIAVPTLFETRRLNQTVDTAGVGGGYQDNRVVSIELNVNGDTDAGELVELLDSYLGNDRSTVSVRRY